MPLLIIRHKVKDFDAWKPVYDDDAGNRSAAGIGPGRVTRSVDDPNEVVLLFEVSDLAKCKAMAASPELKAKMQEAGVIDKPDVFLLDDAM